MSRIGLRAILSTQKQFFFENQLALRKIWRSFEKIRSKTGLQATLFRNRGEIVGQLSGNCRATVEAVGQLSGNCRATVGAVGQLSGNRRATVGQLSGNCRATVGQLSGNCRANVTCGVHVCLPSPCCADRHFALKKHTFDNFCGDLTGMQTKSKIYHISPSKVVRFLRFERKNDRNQQNHFFLAVCFSNPIGPPKVSPNKNKTANNEAALRIFPESAET